MLPTPAWPCCMQCATSAASPGKAAQCHPSHCGTCCSAGSPVLSDLAQTVRPRYHVAGTRNTFWARPPYSNKDLGAGAHVTRFISLGSVDNPGKQKWLHALGMVPAAVMDLATLHLQPEVCVRVIEACDWLWLHDEVLCAAGSRFADQGHLQIQVVCSCCFGSCHPEQECWHWQAEAPLPCCHAGRSPGAMQACASRGGCAGPAHAHM